MESDRHDVFLDCDGVLKFAMAVEELLKPCHLVVRDFLLRLQLSFKHTRKSFDDRRKSFAEAKKCFDTGKKSFDALEK